MESLFLRSDPVPDGVCRHLQEDLKRGTVDLIAKTLEEARTNGKDSNGASSAHPLHTGLRIGEKMVGKDSK
jgi:hypothetical protein